MSISLKKTADIKSMTSGGKKLSYIMRQLVKGTKIGTNLLDIEAKANQLIKTQGGEPAFKRVSGYHWATCLNVNEGIVHGIPKDYVLKAGDVLSIDLGLYYQGFNTDMDYTFIVGKLSSLDTNSAKKTERFLLTGRQTLRLAIEKAKPGNYVGHISQQIQTSIEAEGYNCARSITGHGIGKNIHEDPLIPCILVGEIEATPRLQTGMALAIEVIYTMGYPELVVDPQDKWTIKAKDGKITAVFEETVIIGKNKALSLTKLPE